MSNNKNVKIYKSFQKKMNIISYYLLKHNQLSIRAYVFLIVLFDYIFMIMLPAQVIMNIGSNNSNQTFLTLNFVILLGQVTIFNYLTDVINGLLLISLIIVVIHFMRIKNHAILIKSNSNG